MLMLLSSKLLVALVHVGRAFSVKLKEQSGGFVWTANRGWNSRPFCLIITSASRYLRYTDEGHSGKREVHMNVEKLSHFVELAETHRKVLSGYSGAYSLGIGQDLQRGRNPVLILQVEKQSAATFPDEVRLDGETVPVVVRTGFVAPHALASSH